MTYELCLEYGTYPLRPVDAWADEINTASAFITEDKKTFRTFRRSQYLIP